jgi:hypothetical protein
LWTKAKIGGARHNKKGEQKQKQQKQQQQKKQCTPTTTTKTNTTTKTTKRANAEPRSSFKVNHTRQPPRGIKKHFSERATPKAKPCLSKRQSKRGSNQKSGSSCEAGGKNRAETYEFTILESSWGTASTIPSDACRRHSGSLRYSVVLPIPRAFAALTTLPNRSTAARQ